MLQRLYYSMLEFRLHHSPAGVVSYLTLHKFGYTVMVIIGPDLDGSAILQLRFDIAIWLTRNEYL